VRIAVVGHGLIGRRRAAAIQAIEGVTLAATVDPAAAGDGTVPHYASLDDLPSSAYDAAIIAVPHDVAGSLVARVLEAGKPVLIEKPLGTSGQEARRLEALADGLSQPSFVGYNYRFLPAIERLLGAVAEERFGPLRSIDMLIGHGGHPGSAQEWKLDPARAGGGVLLDPGVHLLDLLLQIAPDAACTAIEASRGFWPTGIEEDVAMTFRAGQLLATLRVSHVRWVNTFRIETFGEAGYAIAEGRGGNYGPMTLRFGDRWGWTRAEGTSQPETEEQLDFGTQDTSMRAELEAVIAAWRSDEQRAGTPHPATMAEARAVTELCDSLYVRIG
jgi:predicted dehydrogenase